MDVVDEVVDAGVLDTVPFPIFYHRTMRGLPSFTNIDKSGTNTFLAHQEDKVILANITICEALLTQRVDRVTDIEKEVKAALIDDMDSDSKGAAGKTVSFNNKDSVTQNKPLHQPIIVPKPKWKAKTQNLWKENLKDDENSFEYLLQNRLSHTLRRKTESEFPEPNPAFAYTYDDSKDRAELEKNIIFEDNISANKLRNRAIDFVKEFWDVFREDHGVVCIPVQGYEMVIDTGDAKPIAVRQPRY
eukprot:scaffold76438_cov60-Attheya_sp.AAC.1